MLKGDDSAVTYPAFGPIRTRFNSSVARGQTRQSRPATMYLRTRKTPFPATLEENDKGNISSVPPTATKCSHCCGQHCGGATPIFPPLVGSSLTLGLRYPPRAPDSSTDSSISPCGWTQHLEPSSSHLEHESPSRNGTSTTTARYTDQPHTTSHNRKTIFKGNINKIHNRAAHPDPPACLAYSP